MTEYKIAFSNMEMDGKLPPGSPLWKQFNASFENLELAPPAIGLMIDAGHAFTTWHKDNWRQSDNFILGQHLGVDFDTMGVSDALRDPFVQRFASFVYRTPSSTDDAPRCRVVFLLDKPIVIATNYTNAAKALIWMFGAAADAKCKDATRFFYGSLGSMPTHLNGVLPVAKVKELIASHSAFEQAQQTPRTKRTFTASTPDEHELQDILARVSTHRADNYEEWVNVGMALHTAGDNMLSLWDSWSARSPKYNAGECERKWQSFKRGTGVGIGTLIHYAQQDNPR